MGRKRKAIERLPCDVCQAPGHDPCRHKVTGKPIKGFHCVRRLKGVDDHNNATLRKLDGMDKEFWMWVHRFFNLKEGDYHEPTRPQEWADLYAKYPELDPGNQYNAEW